MDKYFVTRIDLRLDRDLLSAAQQEEDPQLEIFTKIFGDICGKELERHQGRPLERPKFKLLTAMIQQYLLKVRKLIEEKYDIDMPEDYMVVGLYNRSGVEAEEDQGRLLARITESLIDTYPPR